MKSKSYWSLELGVLMYKKMKCTSSFVVKLVIILKIVELSTVIDYKKWLFFLDKIPDVKHPVANFYICAGSLFV